MNITVSVLSIVTWEWRWYVNKSNIFYFLNFLSKCFVCLFETSQCITEHHIYIWTIQIVCNSCVQWTVTICFYDLAILKTSKLIPMMSVFSPQRPTVHYFPQSMWYYLIMAYTSEVRIFCVLAWCLVIFAPRLHF